MAGQRCSSSEFQGFSVPAAAAAVRAWAASASQQFSVSEFQRLSVPAAAAAARGRAALQQFRVSGFKRSELLRRRCVAGQRCSSSEFQGFSVPAAAAAVRAWAASASQQFGVSAFERCCCPAGGACPASASPQQFRVSEFQRLSVAAAAAAGRGWAALQQFSGSAVQRSGCGGRGACLGSVSVAAVRSFRV